MDGLLRKKDLVDAVGVAKSTIADWVTEFSVYIPTVKHGAVTYFKPEALDVLNAIRELREQDQSKVQIMELLRQKGFPITVEEAVEDVERAISGTEQPRDSLMAVVNMVGQAYAEVGKVTERQNRIESTISEHDDRLDGQDGRLQTVEEKQDEQVGRMADLERKIEEMQQQLMFAQAETAAAKQEASQAKEQASKSVWRRLFGG